MLSFAVRWPSPEALAHHHKLSALASLHLLSGLVKLSNISCAGFIVKSTSDAMTPTNFSINAIPCKVFLVNNITGEHCYNSFLHVLLSKSILTSGPIRLAACFAACLGQVIRLLSPDLPST